jgi:hypothetical protein
MMYMLGNSKKTLATLLVIATTVCGVGMVSAQDKAASTATTGTDKTTGSGPNPYVDCGIGAALFKDTDWAAVISNVTWDAGSTAITSATMSPQTCNKQKAKVALFIRDTQPQLAEEVAVGQGAHLTAVLNLSECPTTRHANAIQSIRTSMADAIAAPTYTSTSGIEKSTVMYHAVEVAVSKSCSI